LDSSGFKVPFNPKIRYEIEIKHRPSVPDNIKHWKLFQDEKELDIFLNCVEEFDSSQIDQDEDIGEDKYDVDFEKKISNHEIIQLKSNHIPKGRVPLERLFDNNDVLVKPSIQHSEHDVEDCNIGTSVDPKFVKLSKSLSQEKKIVILIFLEISLISLHILINI
jgi:hypothetical protein